MPLPFFPPAILASIFPKSSKPQAPSETGKVQARPQAMMTRAPSGTGVVLCKTNKEVFSLLVKDGGQVSTVGRTLR